MITRRSVLRFQHRVQHPVALSQGRQRTLLPPGFATWRRRSAYWDSVILAAAAEAGCRLLVSEDMQAGFTCGGVTIVNPFAAKPDPALALLLHVRT